MRKEFFFRRLAFQRSLLGLEWRLDLGPGVIGLCLQRPTPPSTSLGGPRSFFNGRRPFPYESLT